MKILIHHHTVAHFSNGSIWIQSFIANWINSLSPHFEQIGLLLHESENKRQIQDTQVFAHNVVFHSLGSEGKTWDRIQRIQRIKKQCRIVSPHYDVLLIRGLTPRQFTIWEACNIGLKAYLLVGSIKESKPRFNLANWYVYFMDFIRKRELILIARKSLCIANSSAIAIELESITKRKTYFLPTSSISVNDLQGFIPPQLNESPKILFCGRVNRDKGIFELVESLVDLKRVYPNIELLIAGQIASEVKLELEKIIIENTLKENIRWLGFVSYGKDLFATFKAADYCVLPSYHEGFPHTIWEAGICSVSMVTTKVGGIPGIVNETHVTFVETKNSKSITNTILTLQNNLDLRIEKARKLYELATEFTLEKSALKLKELLNKHQ